MGNLAAGTLHTYLPNLGRRSSGMRLVTIHEKEPLQICDGVLIYGSLFVLCLSPVCGVTLELLLACDRQAREKERQREGPVVITLAVRSCLTFAKNKPLPYLDNLGHGFG